MKKNNDNRKKNEMVLFPANYIDWVTLNACKASILHVTKHDEHKYQIIGISRNIRYNNIITIIFFLVKWCNKPKVQRGWDRNSEREWKSRAKKMINFFFIILIFLLLSLCDIIKRKKKKMSNFLNWLFRFKFYKKCILRNQRMRSKKNTKNYANGETV